MGLKKQLSDYTEEELLEIAAGTKDRIIPIDPKTTDSNFEAALYGMLEIAETDVPLFLFEFKIRDGKNLVKKSVLFKLYKQWSKNPLNSLDFYKKTSQYIPVKQIDHDYFYMIDKKALQITAFTLKLLEDSQVDKSKSKTYHNHFKNFLRFYELTEGNHWIESYVLYYLYDKWTYKNHKPNPLSEKNFFKFCKLYFPDRRNGSSRGNLFRVNDAIYKHLSPEIIEEIRKGRQRWAHRKGFKRKQRDEK